MLTTCNFTTSFSAAFQGAINGLRIFRRSEIGRSNQFGVASIFPLGLHHVIDGPRQMAFLYRKGGPRWAFTKRPAHVQVGIGLQNEHQKDLGSVRFKRVAAHFSKGTKNNMTLHSRPLACLECPFRMARGRRLRHHLEKNHPGGPSAQFLQTVGQQVSQSV